MFDECGQRITTTMPKLSEIACYWRSLPELEETFTCRPNSWDFGEPFCFRCGWRAPVKCFAGEKWIDWEPNWSEWGIKDGNDMTTALREWPREKFEALWAECDQRRKLRHPQMDDDGILNLVWKNAGGWLERAHLHDHCQSGNDDLSNLVPLCIGCHLFMPSCDSRQAGIDYVNESASKIDEYPRSELKWMSKREQYWMKIALQFQGECLFYTEMIRAGHTREIMNDLQPPSWRSPNKYTNYLWPRGEKSRHEYLDEYQRCVIRLDPGLSNENGQEEQEVVNNAGITLEQLLGIVS